MTNTEAAMQSWASEIVRTLQTVAALGHLSVRDAAIVFTDMEVLRRAVDENAVVLHNGQLWPVNESVAATALATMEASARSDLFGELAALPLSEFVVARLSDLALPDRDDERLAQRLAASATRAAQFGYTDIALDLWLRSAARTKNSSPLRVDRVIRSAEQAIVAGDFELARQTLDELNFGTLSLEQTVVAAHALASALYQAHGVELARLRLEQRRNALAPDNPTRVVFDVILAGLHDHHGVALRELEAVLPRVESEVFPAHLQHSALSLLVEAKVNVGLGLDRALLARMHDLEETLDVRLQETASATEAYLAHQTGDAAVTKRLAPELIVKAEAAGDVAYQEVILVHGALADIDLGHFANASRQLANAFSLRGQKSGSPAAVRAEALLALELGDHDAFRAVLARPHLTGRASAGAFTRAGLQGIYLAESGDLDGATELLKDCLRVSRRMGIEEPGRRMWAEVHLALVSARGGALATARALAGKLEQLAARSERLILTVEAARIRAWIAHREQRWGAVRTYLGIMLTELPTISWLPERSRILTDMFALLPRDHDSSQLAEQLGAQARTILGLLEDGVARRGLIEGLRTLELTTLSDLTAAEWRVVESVTRGLSNKATAEALFLSPRTVESHLSSIYRKLGISSRSQLVGLVRGKI